MFAKSASYYYDWEAISEEAVTGGQTIKQGPKSLSMGQAKGAGVKPSGNALKTHTTVPERRNKRSVWEFPTRGITDSHFAPFPPELPRLCILAGSKKNDWVLDCFAGSGTTGFVALKLGRRFVGVELSPESVKILNQRFVRAIPSLSWEMY